MQNNNSKLNTVLLAIIAILLAIAVWWLLVHGKESKLFDDVNPIPNDQTKTDTNSNQEQHQPAAKVYTVSELIDGENLSNISCESTAPGEGKEFTVTGYMYPSDIWGVQHDKATVIRNGANMTGATFSLTLDSNSVGTITQKYNKNNTAWIHLKAHGVLQGMPMPIMGNCLKGFGLVTDNVTIID